MKTVEKNQIAVTFGGFFLISVLCCSPMLFFGKTLVLRDTFFEFRFLYDYLKQNVSNGIIPLWNPYSNCGQPFIANPQVAFFYPFTWFFYLLNFHQAYTFYLFIHLLLAGTFMHAFLKPITGSNWISFFGGIIYMLNGLLISRIEFLSEFSSIIWIPAILVLLRINVISPTWLSSALLGLSISIQFFAGHTQVFYYTVLLGIIFVIFLGFLHFVRGKKTHLALKSMKFLAAACILALLIAMIQLVPTYELFTQSIRSQPAYDPKTSLSSLHPGHTLSFLYPYIFGWPGYRNYWGSTYEFWASSFYIGVIPFICFLLAGILFISVKKTRFETKYPDRYYFIFFLASFLIGFVIALGDYTPIFKLLYDYVPGFDKFRWPSSSLLICTISLSVMAPLGLKWFLQFTKNRSRTSSLWFTGPLLALLLGSLLFAFVMNTSPNRAEKVVAAVKPTSNLVLQDLRDNVEGIAASSMLSDAQHLSTLGNAILFNTAFVVIICFLLWIRLSGKIQDGYLIACVLLCTAIDLIGNGSIGVPFLDKHVNEKKPQILEAIPESDKNQRILARTDDIQQYVYGATDEHTLFLGIDSLTGEVGLAQRLFRTDGKGILKIRNYSDFSGFLNLPFHMQLKIIKFLNVKYLLQLRSNSIEENAATQPNSKRIDEYQKMAAWDSTRWSVQLTEINGPMPRITVVPHYLVMKSDTVEQKQAIFRHFFDESFDFTNAVILEEPIGEFSEIQNVYFKIKEGPSYENPNQVRAVIETDQDGILVISDVFYPGWELYINQKKQKIYKANTAFRAAFLKAGNNDVLFKYYPKSFKFGLSLSLIGIALFFVLLIGHFRIHRRQKQ